ncbi:helix-turn-helix domain-containing protein [Novosphingobium sp. G106]|uniref:helix-turn-helix domain-containing protein n=1 Tax=Novosphingobium sp. G106 TaxID=2849500 RepID=UPI001C2D6EE6|nr:helix-turn-helix domain-containing protein [Novosphingobium sp. G106]MBV1691839.1 helix-turn-helix domain-containing protein [Novosphingobium sp. G106]
MKLIEISEVAKRSGITASTLRFYEEKGLIESLGRRGLRRTYGQDVFGRLSLVTLGRLAGFSLDQISAMFGSGPSAQIDRVPLSDKAAELDRTIRQLNALKNGLEHAAICPAPSHMECPSFRRFLKIAAARSGKLSSKQVPILSR